MNYITMNLKRLLKRKVNLLFMLIAPFVLVTFASMMGASSFDMKISYVDNDKSVTSKMLIEKLKTVGSVYEISPEQVDMELINGNHDISIIIDDGLEDDIVSGKTPEVELRSIKGADLSFPVTVRTDNFISSAMTISAAAGGERDKYLQALQEYDRDLVSVNVEVTENRALQRVVTRMAIGFLFMNMLFLASQTTSVLLDDKKKKVFYRIFSGPTTTFRYMLENIASFYMIMLIQIAIIMGAMFGIYGMYYGESLLNMFLLFAVFGIMAVAFGTAIATVSKTPSQAGAMASLVITPISMLGGFFWDVNLMPEFLQRLADFLPTTWGIKAASLLLDAKSLSEISLHILVLLLFTAGFFVLGALKKTDIAA